jgi:hypothetical protein
MVSESEEKMMMKTKLIVVCVVVAVLAIVLPASAEFNVDKFTYSSSTKMNPGAITAFGGTTWVRSFNVNSVTPNPVIGNNTVQSFFDVWLEISTDGGTTWSPRSGTGSIETTPTLGGINGGVETWNISVSSTNAMVPGLLLRESPFLSSSGTNTYTPVTGGYSIDSFFDVWLEISTDGGNTWQPTTATRNAAGNWSTGNLATRIIGPPDTAQGGDPVIIQSAMNLFRPQIGFLPSVTVNDFHVRFRVNKWEKNGYTTFLGSPMTSNYLSPSGFYGPGIVTFVDQNDGYIEITWTFPDMQISDLSMPWFGFTFGNGIYRTPNGFRYQAVEWYWTYNGQRVSQYDVATLDVWQDWIKVWDSNDNCWKLQDVVVNRQPTPRAVTLTSGSLMNPTAPLTIADLAIGGIYPPNPVLPPPNPVLPGNGGTVVTPWPWPGTDPYYYMYYDVAAGGPTPGASFRNAVILANFERPTADLNRDYFVDFEDFAVFAGQWLTGLR